MSETTNFEEVSIIDLINSELFIEMAQRISYEGHISKDLFCQHAEKAFAKWEKITGKRIDHLFYESPEEKLKDVIYLGDLLFYIVRRIISSGNRLKRVKRTIAIYLRFIFIDG